MLQSIRLQRVRHDLVTEQQQSYVERLSLKLEKFGLFYPPIMNEASYVSSGGSDGYSYYLIVVKLQLFSH